MRCKFSHKIGEVQFVVFTGCTKHASAGPLIHRRQNLVDLCTDKNDRPVSTDVNLLTGPS